MDREYLSSLKREFYNDENDFSSHVELFEERQEEIESWFSDKDNYVVLFAYKLAILKYGVGLIKLGRYKDAEDYLLKIETNFRAYSHSEEKQKLLEIFQYYLAYSFYTTGNHYRAREAFDKLLQCNPDNESYIKAWKENEMKISKKIVNTLMLVGLVITVGGWYGEMQLKMSVFEYVKYFGIAIVGAGGVLNYYKNVKLR